MIALEAVSTRRAPLALASITLAWGPGTHAIVGSRADGGPLLLSVIAGLTRARTGRVRVLGSSPTDAGVRRQIAFVPLEPALPDAMRVREAIALAAAIRREPARGERERLATLGIESLTERTVRSLSRAETRAVALAEAVTSTVVRVLLLEEPFVATDPRTAGRIGDALQRRARDGCAVIMTTASMRDARELADEVVGLRRGAIVLPMEGADDLVGTDDGGRVAVSVVLRNASAAHSFIAAMANDVDIERVERDAASLTLRGREATAVARAAGRAAIHACVDIAELRIDGPLTTTTGSAGAEPGRRAQ